MKISLSLLDNDALVGTIGSIDIFDDSVVIMSHLRGIAT